MMNDILITQLINITQLDIDAVHAYEQALKNIDRSDIYKNIDEFRTDHLKHIDDLSRAIIELGGDPPKRTKDFKGYLIEGFTSLRSITGTEGALKAMVTNEKLTNKTYAATLEELADAPENIKNLLEKNYADEQRHLRYIEDTLTILQK